HAHIGHARAAVIFDVICRYLKYRGYQVTYVRNFTDVDDKIINRAINEETSCEEIAGRYIKEYTDDMNALGVETPTHEPLATEHIRDIIETVKTLIERGYAYELAGDVYFEVKKFSEYGKLSKKNTDEQLAGARVEIDERKKDPRDFALWKKSKPNEPSWLSPWGEGRPGWHIECSVMSQKYLGETIDIHGGGRDLIFPHHENEIAQAEAATGKPFVRYWIHNGFININHEKMSKSLGNIFNIKDILKEYHPEVVRLFLLSHHYRSPVDFSPETMKEAEVGIERIYTTLGEIDSIVGDKNYPAVEEDRLNEADREIYDEVKNLSQRFDEAMNEDFNTALSIGHIYNTVRNLNRYFSSREFAATDQVCAIIAEAKTIFSRIGKVLGLFQVPSVEYLKMVKNKKLTQLDITVDEIEILVEERNQARKGKKWDRADQIRETLLKKNIILKDGWEKTTWKIK
ncbi:MAG: cysteine--tRNA ligase, partial [Deltaproteobacteria bacterium]|nr:cysteine--tRNA ligase [Deltaproteobacteria bacterium]